MDWDVVAPMFVSVIFILTVGGVILLRPIAKRLGLLLETMAQQKAGAPPDELRRIRQGLDTTNERLSLLEERQDFMERLVERGAHSRDGADLLTE